MSWFAEHIAQGLIIVGLALLAIEIAILGLSTFVLFFVGVAALVSGVILYFELIAPTIPNALLLVSVFTVTAAVMLWKPLKKLQVQVDKTPAQSDLIGHEFILPHSVSPDTHTNYRYSGIDWQLKSDAAIVAGTKVKVVSTEVGTFHIEQAS